VLQRESEQLHGLLQRLREHLKEVQDRAFEFVAALSFATVFVSGMSSIDGLSTVPPTCFGRGDRDVRGAARQRGWNKLQAARCFKVWQSRVTQASVVTRSLLQIGRAPGGVLHAESQQLHGV
jgi:hypothetical protein